MGGLATLATLIAIWQTGAQEDLLPPGSHGTSYAPSVVSLWLDADRDLGALPARSGWCAGSDHCWVFQQSSGDATDYGDVGGWHLSPYGSPRAGVLASVPTRDATGWVDYTSELTTYRVCGLPVGHRLGIGDSGLSEQSGGGGQSDHGYNEIDGRRKPRVDGPYQYRHPSRRGN